MAKMRRVKENDSSVKSQNKKTAKQTSKMKAYRFRVETIEALDKLRMEVNKKTNIKISATNILELLVLNAAKEDVGKIIRLINNK